MTALQYLLDGNVMSAVNELMQDFTDHNGGERRDADVHAEQLTDDLEYIMAQKVEDTLETAGDSTGESATLKALHQEGVDQADGVKAKVFGPTDAYPAPWTAQHVGGKYPIYAIKASNKAQVATWLNQTNANKIISEIS